jgi:hypothetical protein
MMSTSEGTADSATCSTAPVTALGVPHPLQADGFAGSTALAGELTSPAPAANFFRSFCDSLGNFFIDGSGVVALADFCGGVVGLLSPPPCRSAGGDVTVGEGNVSRTAGWSVDRMAAKKDLSLKERIQQNYYTFSSNIVTIRDEQHFYAASIKEFQNPYKE